MEAFIFDISLPTNWSQLTDSQLRFLFAQLAKNRPAYDTETRCLLKWGDIEIVDQLHNGKFIFRRKRSFLQHIMSATKHFKHPLHSEGLGEAAAFFNATRTLKFIEELPPYPVRISRIGFHHALPADFLEVPFEKYLYCDNLYQGYLETKSDDFLREMAQILYDSERIRPSRAELVGVFYWFAALKSFFSRKFHHFLRPIGETSTTNLLATQRTIDNVEESMNSQIRALTKGDITKEKQVLSLDTWRALTELDAKAQDAEEIRKSVKT